MVRFSFSSFCCSCFHNESFLFLCAKIKFSDLAVSLINFWYLKFARFLIFFLRSDYFMSNFIFIYLFGWSRVEAPYSAKGDFKSCEVGIFSLYYINYIYLLLYALCYNKIYILNYFFYYIYLFIINNKVAGLLYSIQLSLFAELGP